MWPDVCRMHYICILSRTHHIYPSQHPLELPNSDVVCSNVLEACLRFVLIGITSTRAWKVAPALACGCTIVMKPSEFTPLTALVRLFYSHSCASSSSSVFLFLYNRPTSSPILPQILSTHVLESHAVGLASATGGEIVYLFFLEDNDRLT